jgi:hypothetical protein
MSASHDKCIVDRAQMLGLRFEPRGIGELEPPRSTVYKDIRTHDAGWGVEVKVSRVCRADFCLPQTVCKIPDFKAEVVELADTPS